MNVYELAPRFRALFDGLDTAFGTGEGKWIKRPPRTEDFVRHLQGEGPGIGIAPLRPDDTVRFAAIDLDEPDFDLGREFQKWLPGHSFIERTRSGNVHVWVFFSEPVEAWVAAGILRYAVTVVGAPHTEVFPKATSLARLSLGSYINLPYHGDERPILYESAEYDEKGRRVPHLGVYPLADFLYRAEQTLNSPEDWRRRARWLMIEDPAAKPQGDAREFGTSSHLHMCAEHVVEGALSGERPIAQGHRSVVYFNLAKQFANCALWNFEEALQIMADVRDVSDAQLDQPRKPNSELERYLRNAYEKQYTSTGCDDPVFGPYAHPNCPIANPRR